MAVANEFFAVGLSVFGVCVLSTSLMLVMKSVPCAYSIPMKCIRTITFTPCAHPSAQKCKTI